MFAPNADQMHVVNHCAGKPTEEKRNILQESARIARGDVTDLVELNVSEFDAVIIPGKPATLSFSFSVLILLLILPVSGGFGAAKNLCDWAVKSKNCAVQPDIEKLIKAFHKPGKPLGMCCISPVLAAKVLPGCELTVGHDKECDKYVNPFNTISTWGGGQESQQAALNWNVFSPVRWPYAQTAGAVREMGCKHVGRGQSSRGCQKQAGHHLRVHVQCSCPSGV